MMEEVTNFNEIYGAAVDTYIYNTKLYTIIRNGETWYVDCGLCMRRSEHYKVPDAVIELLNVGSTDNVVKFGTYALQLKLYTRPKVMEGMFNAPNMTFVDTCYICRGRSYDPHGYVWTSSENTICEDCLDENLEESDMYIRVNVTEYNATDYVLFAKDSMHGRYYVNCNTTSAQYGNVVHHNYTKIWSVSDGNSIIYPSVEHLLDAIREWVCEPEQNYQLLTEWEEFLNSPVKSNLIPRDAIVYGFDNNMTYRDIVVNIDYVRGFSEELVKRYVELIKNGENRKKILDKRARRRISNMKPAQLTEYVRSRLRKRAGDSMFMGDMLTFINGYIRTIYGRNAKKSFGQIYLPYMPPWLFFYLKN